VITFSKQNIGSQGKELKRSPGPPPCAGRATQSQLPRAVFRRLLNITREGAHSLSVQPVPVLGHPHSEKCFLSSSRISRVSVCAHCLWSHHWAPVQRVWLCPLCTLPLYICMDFKIPLSLLFSRLNSPSSLSFSSYERCSSPLIIYMKKA